VEVEKDTAPVAATDKSNGTTAINSLIFESLENCLFLRGYSREARIVLAERSFRRDQVPMSRLFVVVRSLS
jgi:hypothetical protein